MVLAVNLIFSSAFVDAYIIICIRSFCTLYINTLLIGKYSALNRRAAISYVFLFDEDKTYSFISLLTVF